MRLPITSLVLVGLATAAPVVAQQADEAAIDALIDATATIDGTLTLARSQAAGGSLIDAAATLERALLDRPGTASDPIRLYYASVLCRLGDPRRAAYQVGNVRSVDAAARAEVTQACGDITIPTTTNDNAINGEVSVGVAYDGDAYGALATQLNLPLFPSLSQDGFSLTTSARLDGRFGTSDTHYFYGGASLLTKTSIDGPRLNYQVGAGRFGYAARLSGSSDVSFGGVVRHARLFNRPFVTEFGGQAALGFGIGATARAAFDIEAVGQRYHGTAIDFARNGQRYDFAASLQAQPKTGHSYVAGIAFELKDARLRSLGYRGVRAFAGASFPIADNGAYLGVSGTARYVDHRNTGVATDLTEWRLFARAAVGVPLGPQGLFAEAAATYTSRHYNAASLLRDYNSPGAELRLVYRFGK